MKEEQKFPYQEDLLELRHGEQLVLHIESKTFIVTAATDHALETINCGRMFIQ